MRKLLLEVIERWLKDDDWRVREAAMNACSGRTDIPVEVIERGLNDADTYVRTAAMNACNGRSDIPVEVIERGLKDADARVREAAMNACIGRSDIPLEVIDRWLNDADGCVRIAAMNACIGRSDIPLEVIERWLNDANRRVRVVAMNACSGRTDIPVEVIERGLKDDYWHVREMAMNACKSIGLAIPTVRTIEPPEKVYKKCLCGVIVVAEIPKDAQVRGTYNGKCRSNKAKIIEVIGEVAGENVGISLYDKQTAYYAGDEICIDDFDMSNEECSTGFHFFCTKEQAENYRF